VSPRSVTGIAVILHADDFRTSQERHYVLELTVIERALLFTLLLVLEHKIRQKQHREITKLHIKTNKLIRINKLNMLRKESRPKIYKFN
jgi:UDP-2,3-diacylglucosamine pyrophosphatase LpxH